MRSFGLPLTATTLFPARLAKITRRDGVVLRIAEAEEAITVAAQTYTPLPGCDWSVGELSSPHATASATHAEKTTADHAICCHSRDVTYPPRWHQTNRYAIAAADLACSRRMNF